MSIFGQVWLWSIAAFLIGVLLTWMMLVRPVQARNRKLERRLREARTAPVSAPPRRPARPAAPAEDRRRPVDRYQPAPGFTERQQPEPGLTDRYELGSQPTEKYRPDPGATDRHSSEPQLTDQFPADPGLTQRYQPDPQTSDRNQPEPEPFWSSFDPDPEPEPEPEPPPAGEPQELAWFERDRVARAAGDGVANPSLDGVAKPGVDGAAKEEPQLPPPSATEFVGLSSVLEPEKPQDPDVTSVFKKIDEAPGEERGSERGSLFGTSEPGEGELAVIPEPAAAPEPVPPAYAFGGDQKPSGSEAATEVTQVLPRRKPQKTPRSAFEPPRKRLEPSMRPIERRDPATLDQGGQSGSLFEPVTPANSPQASGEKTPSERPPRDSAVPSGPFGPGSAMPRPGGGRPADDFVVKASVTALRYCTEDSPQYPRMVAEVWFRSAAEAERVGFRPVT